MTHHDTFYVIHADSERGCVVEHRLSLEWRRRTVGAFRLPLPEAKSIEDVIEEARSYLGVPWLHQGRSKSGVDCLGLLVCAFGAVGWRPRKPENVRAFATPDYRRRAGGEAMLEAFRAEGEELPLDETLSTVHPGDILVFRFQGDEFAQHTGIVTERRAGGAA